MTATPGDLSSFGALLKTLRTRRRLTQHQLAVALGMHRHAIGRWEQGDFLPASKAIVLELAGQLHLDTQETRLLLEASMTALSPLWLVPLPRNPFFTGREELLRDLHADLCANRTVALTQSVALHGLGGIGKTQVALEYAYRHALEYSAVFWIGAETGENVFSSLLHIAELLQLPERGDTDQQHVVAAVQHWLNTHHEWLLIWDNVEDLSLLSSFLPGPRPGTMLITTRCQTLGTLAWGRDLLPMEREEGMRFLLRRAKVLEAAATGEQMRQFGVRQPDQYAAAAELVTVLGGLPLALDQAGAYIEETRCGTRAYLDLFRTQRAVLLQQRGERVQEHPASVSATLTLALTATAQRHPAVGDLLLACAMLRPDSMPEEVFRQGADHLGPALQTACRDPLEWNRVVALAGAYSLLHRHPEEQSLSMHRLVQAVQLDSLSASEQARWNRAVIAALDEVFPVMPSPTDARLWKQGERLLVHALVCLDRAGSGEDSPVCASLARKVARYLHERGRYREAEPLYRRASSLLERALGSEHPEVAQVWCYLALLYTQQRQHQQAEPLYQQALALQDRVLGPEHPETARTLHNLAALWSEQGKYLQAEPLFLRALRIREHVPEPHRHELARTLNGLATLYVQWEKYEQAEPLFQRALSIWTETLGPQHPDLMYALEGLAILWSEQGKYEQAEPLFQQALAIVEQSLGPEHPNVAYILVNHAELCVRRGKYEQAASLYQRASSIWTQALGAEDPRVASILASQADLALRQRSYAEAGFLYQRALAIQERILGGDHPETAATRMRYAQLVKEHPSVQAEAPSNGSLDVEARQHAPPSPGAMRITVRGPSGQAAYTRTVQMREVTFTCRICRRTVSQWHYPSGRIRYCSEACRAISAAQRQEERVARQREKRRTARGPFSRTMPKEPVT